MHAFGLKVEKFVFPEDISDREFKEAFKKINEDSRIDGILRMRLSPPRLFRRILRE